MQTAPPSSKAASSLSRPPPPISVYGAAAKQGFSGVGDRLLDKIIQSEALLEGIPAARRPRGVLRKTELLVKHFLPSLSDAEVGLIMRKRAGIDKLTQSSPLLVGDNIKLCEGVVETKDLEEARDFKKTSHKSETGKGVASLMFLRERKYIDEDEFQDYIKTAMGAPAAHTGPKQTHKTAWTCDEASLKQRLPSGVKGCTIQEVFKADGGRCWTARYLGATPGSRSRSYRGEVERQVVAKSVLLWAWQQHKAMTGCEIPHGISSM